MKRVNSIFIFTLLVLMAGCGGDCKQSTDRHITVDIAKSYPKKELILQDIFDVEYISLDDTDEFVTSGSIQYIGKDIIAVRNMSTSLDGDIFLFDRKGKGLRRINRKGQGPEEYMVLNHIVLDENNNEMFVCCLTGDMLVYDLFGNFKRRFKSNRVFNFSIIDNFDLDHLIFYNNRYDIVNGNIEVPIGVPKNSFFIMDKKDGSIIKEIEIPFKEKRWAMIATDIRQISIPFNRTLMPLPHSNWIIFEASSDTIYCVMPDYSLMPFIARVPSIQSMNPEVFLFPGVVSDRYYFMQTAIKEYNFSTNTGWPKIDLVYDRQENVIFEYVVYNDDFLNKVPIKLILDTRPVEFPISNEIPFCMKFEAYKLIEDYKTGQLKGKLEEIASKLNEDSNPVIMIAKHKKTQLNDL